LSRVARFRVEPICTVLQVAPSTYYAAKGRAPSARAVSDAVVTPQLVTLWEANYRVYGARKLWKAARRAGGQHAAPPRLPRRRPTCRVGECVLC
jgi:hypothetical protein